MAKKKLTARQKNAAKLEDLLKQKVTTSTGFLKKDFKGFIAEEMVNAANRSNRVLKSNETLQSRYDKFAKYYDKLFTTGLTGHAQFTGIIEKQARKDIDKGIEYVIEEKGKQRKVSYSELAYKMELLSHKLSTQHDIAFTKFKPTYILLGKGQYRIKITIPDLTEADFDEMTTEEVLEFFEENNIEIIVSDPTKLKNEKARTDATKAKKQRQTKIRKTKEKYYKQWKRGSKAAKTRAAKRTKPTGRKRGKK